MVFPFTNAVAGKSVNVYGRYIAFSSARCVFFINPCQVRQNIFQPLNKCLCVFLLLRGYRVTQASINTVCGTICCSYIVKIARTIDPWVSAREQLTTNDDTTQRGSSFLFWNNERGFLTLLYLDKSRYIQCRLLYLVFFFLI